MATSGDPKSALVRHARILGFDAIGFADATEPLTIEFERYKAFIDQGMHGQMGYLKENAAVRETLRGANILDGARTVICLARRYQRTSAEEASDPALAKLVARYARGGDYHNHLRRKLRQLASFCRTLGPDVECRPLCDEEPILERAWAARSGLGFIGKNGLLIIPGQGSFVLLGEVVTTLALAADSPMSDRCGACTRCLEACPTQAFVSPYVLDARKCIAYLTIESPLEEGPASFEQDTEHLFGCDVCQEVCPYNRAPVPLGTRNDVFRPRGFLLEGTLADLVAGRDVGPGPLRRAGVEGLRRHARRILRGAAKPACGGSGNNS